MKAATYFHYGPPEVVHLTDVPTPEPGDNDVLLRVKATAVNSGDWRLRKADPFGVRLMLGLTKPRIHILGAVFSGTIERVGKNVKRFAVGDEVFGHTDMRFGAHAEYLVVPESGSLALKPAQLTHSEAAVIPFGGTSALHFLKKANIKPGQKVLVNGASGAVGSAAVQLAKYFGASVTGVCSTTNVDLVKSLGADHVIDYTQTDFSTSGETYDVIIDTVNKLPFSQCIRLLKKDGVLILSAAELPQMLRGIWTSLTSTQKVLMGVISHTAEDILLLKKLVEIGKLKPVLDKTYPLEKIAEAHGYVEKGHKKGNVAIVVGEE